MTDEQILEILANEMIDVCDHEDLLVKAFRLGHRLGWEDYYTETGL